MLNLAVYLVARTVLMFVQMMSLSTCHSVANGVGWLLADVLKIRRRLVMENLRHAFPEKSEDELLAIARRMWQHLVLLAFEVVHLPRKIHPTNWRDYIRIDGSDVLLPLLTDGRPVMIVSAHFGNFELASHMLALLGFPPHAVARPLDNPYLHDFINRLRRDQGQQIIPKSGGLEWILEVLEAKGTLALLADQYAGSKGCWVEFFGRQASAHKAIALLALQQEARIVVGYAWRVGGPLEYEIVIQSVADPLDNPAELANPKVATQWYTRQFETFIRRAPEQYWWLHNRWKLHRREREKLAAAGEGNGVEAGRQGKARAA